MVRIEREMSFYVDEKIKESFLDTSAKMSLDNDEYVETVFDVGKVE
ncbi:MAG: hypothetical protein PHX08_17145 [Lachnospiraceae bacterium]|nr:hypothetical protein [Lachnospiraceae bacterium]